jgi:uncharacterized repeat protein (TIGR03803 family)
MSFFNEMKNATTIAKMILLFLAMIFVAANSPAQTFSTLHNFASSAQYPNTAGVEPSGDLILTNGVLYGETGIEGPNQYGAIYSINADGSGFKVLCSNSNSPSQHLTFIGGTLYTTTLGGGTNGAIYSVNTNGTNYKLIYSFAGSGNGAWPLGITSANNTLYGVTEFGSFNNFTPAGGGVLYSIDTNGNNFSILHTFYNMQGGESLILKDNTFYGTTVYGTTLVTNAVVFSIDINGNNFTNLYIFTNGMSARTLIFNQGLLFGTGISNEEAPGGIVFSINTNGSNFTVLHVFTNTPFYLCSSGNLLWGATPDGGLYNGGTIYSMKTNGNNYNVVYDFPQPRFPMGGPSGMVANGITILGTTESSGTNDFGSIFSFNSTPTIQSFTKTNGNFDMTWNAFSNAIYQLQYSTNLPSTNWFNFGNNLTATTTNLIFSDSITNSQRFYRLIYQP